MDKNLTLSLLFFFTCSVKSLLHTDNAVNKNRKQLISDLCHCYIIFTMSASKYTEQDSVRISACHQADLEKSRKKEIILFCDANILIILCIYVSVCV